MDKRLEERLDVNEEKLDLALELLGKLGDAVTSEPSQSFAEELEDWKRRCRARAAARRSRRRKT